MNTNGLTGVMQNAAALCEKSRTWLNNFKAWVQLDSTHLNGGQQLAVKYFTVAVILFFRKSCLAYWRRHNLFFPVFFTKFWILVSTG